MGLSKLLSTAGALIIGVGIGFGGARLHKQGDGGTAEAGLNQAPRNSVTAPSSHEQAASTEIEDQIRVISQDPVRSRRLLALDRFCENLDLEEVRRVATSIPDDSSPENRQLRNRIMSRWAELDPAAAAKFALSLSSDRYSGALQDVLAVWLLHDPEAAKHFFAGRDATVSNDVLHFFVLDLARRDFDEALRFADAVPPSSKEDVIWAAFRAASRNNPAAAIARAMTMPEGKLRNSAVEISVAQWLEQDPEAAVAWVMQHPDMPTMGGQTLFDDCLRRWINQDPAAAASFIPRLPKERQDNKLTSTLAIFWACRDVDQARQWAQGLPEGPAKDLALRRVVDRWSRADPVAAFAFLSQQPPGKELTKALESVAASWAARDPDGAIAWAAVQPDKRFEQKVVPYALGQIAADDPARAVAAFASLREPETRAAAITEIAKNWAPSDPQEAAQWLLDLPTTAASQAALNNVISQGTSQDPLAMAQWLEGMRNHPRRDAAVEAFARQAVNDDPAAAATWANTLSDPKTRRPLVQNIVSTMADYDPSAARAWVLGQRFESDELKSLLEQIDKATRRE